MPYELATQAPTTEQVLVSGESISLVTDPNVSADYNTWSDVPNARTRTLTTRLSITIARDHDEMHRPFGLCCSSLPKLVKMLMNPSCVWYFW